MFKEDYRENISEKLKKYDRPDFPHGCIKEKTCLSIDLEVQEIEHFFRCLAIENILERLPCRPGEMRNDRYTPSEYACEPESYQPTIKQP